MILQIEKYWVRDYLSLFLWGVSTWCFLSNSLMWSLLVMIPDIFSQDISNLCFIKENKPVKGLPYSVGNLGKQPTFISIFFKMAGELAEHITLFASWYCGFPTLQKTSLFFGSYLASLYKPRQACQDGRLEAWRIIRFEWYFLMWSAAILSYRSPFL